MSRARELASNVTALDALAGDASALGSLPGLEQDYEEWDGTFDSESEEDMIE